MRPTGTLARIAYATTRSRSTTAVDTELNVLSTHFTGRRPPVRCCSSHALLRCHLALMSTGCPYDGFRTGSCRLADRILNWESPPQIPARRDYFPASSKDTREFGRSTLASHAS